MQTGERPDVTRRARGRSIVDGSNLIESVIFFPQILSSSALVLTLFDQPNYARVNSLNMNSFIEEET
jgi:hypothetical protein